MPDDVVHMSSFCFSLLSSNLVPVNLSLICPMLVWFSSEISLIVTGGLYICDYIYEGIPSMTCPPPQEFT